MTVDMIPVDLGIARMWDMSDMPRSGPRASNVISRMLAVPPNASRPRPPTSQAPRL
jgi:hypothetical protein